MNDSVVELCRAALTMLIVVSCGASLWNWRQNRLLPDRSHDFTSAHSASRKRRLGNTDGKRVLTELGYYKDGGSISVCFHCDGVDSEVLLKIEYDHVQAFKDPLSPRKFINACLKECHRFQWINKVGETMDDTLECKLRISWETAREVLRELAPQVAGFVSDYRYVFNEMVLVAETEETGWSWDELRRQSARRA